MVWHVLLTLLPFVLWGVHVLIMLEEFEDTKGTIRSRKSKKNKTTQWPTEKGEKDKQRSIEHTHQTKNQVTRIPLKLLIFIN
jgi:hypothetical protein